MSQVAWLTDTHLNVIDDQKAFEFINRVRDTQTDSIIITGDITDSPNLIKHLSMLEAGVQRPIYFVMGNHDYWGQQMAVVRKEISELTRVATFIHYLGDMQFAKLTSKTFLVGSDGWYDAFYGDAHRSRLVMNDWFAIPDFVNEEDRISAFRKLSAKHATHVAEGIKSAVRCGAQNIIVATHVPPFKEASRHQGMPASNESLPFYTSKLMGDMLMRAADAYSNIKFTVLCGHSHDRITHHVRGNLSVHVGGAQYGKPEIQPLITVE